MQDNRANDLAASPLNSGELLGRVALVLVVPLLHCGGKVLTDGPLLGYDASSVDITDSAVVDAGIADSGSDDSLQGHDSDSADGCPA